MMTQNSRVEQVYQRELKYYLSSEKQQEGILAYKRELRDAQRPCLCGKPMWPNRDDSRACSRLKKAVVKRLKEKAFLAAQKIVSTQVVQDSPSAEDHRSTLKTKEF